MNRENQNAQKQPKPPQTLPHRENKSAIDRRRNSSPRSTTRTRDKNIKGPASRNARGGNQILEAQKYWAVTRWSGIYDNPDRTIFEGDKFAAWRTYTQVANRLKRGTAKLINHKGTVVNLAAPTNRNQMKRNTKPINRTSADQLIKPIDTNICRRCGNALTGPDSLLLCQNCPKPYPSGIIGTTGGSGDD